MSESVLMVPSSLPIILASISTSAAASNLPLANRAGHLRGNSFEPHPSLPKMRWKEWIFPHDVGG